MSQCECGHRRKQHQWVLTHRDFCSLCDCSKYRRKETPTFMEPPAGAGAVVVGLTPSPDFVPPTINLDPPLRAVDEVLAENERLREENGSLRRGTHQLVQEHNAELAEAIASREAFRKLEAEHHRELAEAIKSHAELTQELAKANGTIRTLRIERDAALSSAKDWRDRAWKAYDA